MQWQYSLKSMAILVNKLAQAISGVMAGINDGIEQAGNYVDVVRPPEKVVFDGDIIMGLNDLDNKRIVVQQPSSVVTEFSQVVTKEDVYLDGVYNHTNTTTEAPRTTTETTSAQTLVKTTFEDQAIGMKFEYPGPKSK